MAKVPQKYEECIYWKDQEEGFLGYCLYPKARVREPCILNVEDYCPHRDPSMVKEPASVHKCLICGNTMSCHEYEAHGCIFCGSNAGPLVCWESYDVRDRE
ncbi:MAG: hypothetical protein WBN94_02760 [Methanothrix sp.]